MAERQALALLRDASVVILGGPGGVGKTTASAALALLGALHGRRVAVLTIDPARRLGAALGFKRLGNVLTRVPEKTWSEFRKKTGGALAAAMLDTRATFDGMIRRHSPTPDVAKRILKNPVYTELSNALSGTHEYMALEKIYEIRSSGEFDLLVLDTPPSGALTDFLAGPDRIRAFFDPEILKWFQPASAAFGWGMEWVLSLFRKLAGGTILQDVAEFLEASQSLWDGVAERAKIIGGLIRDPGTRFVLVTACDFKAARDAAALAEQLNAEQIPLDTLVLNRTLPEPLGGDDGPARLARRLWQRQESVKADLARLFPKTPVVEAPLRERDPVNIRDLAHFFRSGTVR